MAAIQLCGRSYRIYAPSLEVWPAARWFLAEDDGQQVKFRSSGDLPTTDDADGETPRSWSINEAIALVHEQPEDEVARLLLQQLIYFYFLEPIPSATMSTESE